MFYIVNTDPTDTIAQGYNKSQIMSYAWWAVKNQRVSSLSEALRIIWAEAKARVAELAEAAAKAATKAARAASPSAMIDAAKGKLMLIASPYRDERATNAYDTVCYLAQTLTGFAKDVASTVAKYRKISEKQAYVIARAAVEQNLPICL